MKEPQDAVVFAARLARAFPSLSPYSAATLAEELCAIERAQRRHAERCCSGEDGGYVKREYGAQYSDDPSGLRNVYVKRAKAGGHLVHAPAAQERAGKRIDDWIAQWVNHVRELAEDASRQAPVIELLGDPRGRVLLLHLPGETEAVAL